MAKYCPIEKRKVIYLFCQECENKICLKNKKYTEKIERNETIRRNEK